MKKRIGLLALLLAMVMVLAACGGQENQNTATPEPTKTEEELRLERDGNAAKLAISMVETMMKTAAEKLEAEPESKLARYYGWFVKMDAQNPYRVIILLPTDEQFRTVMTLTQADAEYKIAAGLCTFLNNQFSKDYAVAAESVATEVDAADAGENVIVLLPYEDAVVAVSIHSGKAQGSMVIGAGDFDPVQIPDYTSQIGIEGLEYRNYAGDEMKTLLGR